MISRGNLSGVSRDSATGSPGAEGWRIDSSDLLATSPAAQCVAQLREEGFVTELEGRTVISWDALFTLITDVNHETTLKVLGVPKAKPLAPRLTSTGAPSDSTFKISISGWLDANTRVQVSSAERIGACISWDEQIRLMPEAAWRVVAEAVDLATDGHRLDTTGRMAAAGRIQRAARECKAELDDYLANTHFVSAERITLDIEKNVVLNSPIITLKPVPDGAPDGWLPQFDRYDTVRARYDVPTADGGMSHVVTTDAVRAVLEPIKRMPNRTIASDTARAFLRNPYAVLGESAHLALPIDEFERAREAAGVRFKTLDAGDGTTPAAFHVLVSDPAGTEPDQSWMLSSKDAEQVIQRAAKSRSKGLPLFSWDGEEVELSGATEQTLERLAKWVAQATLGAAALSFAEVFDLSAYSDRVVGFDGKLIAVPYVARKDAGQGWIPENIETGVVVTSTDGSAPRRLPLTADQVTELAGATAKARADGDTTVAIPGSDVQVPTEEAEQWVRSFQEHHAAAKKQAREPALAKNPSAPEERPILRILHNIESLEYSAAKVLPPPALDTAPELPSALRPDVALLPHQLRGVAWLQHRYMQRPDGVSGCLLADDMGLGKTLQALCLMSWASERDPHRRPNLVVAPVSLLENWKSEIEKFFVGVGARTLALYGDALSACRLPSAAIDPELASVGLRKFLRPGFAEGYSIVLTTYETLRDYEFSIARTSWGVLVCDEAQRIKNPSTLVTRAAKALRADFKIACTGTPVENSLADLWCLFDLFQPGLLGSLNEFTKSFRRDIETRTDGHEKLVENLRKSIDPCVLRRLKIDVADLPPKLERDIPGNAPEHMHLKMSPLQQRLYAEAIVQFRAALKSADGRGAMLAMLHRLRTICSNPAAIAFEDAEFLPLDEHLQHSPKLEWILRHLERIHSAGEKAIVFTEFRDVQRLVQRAISARFDLHAEVVNGSTSVDPTSDQSRQRVIDRYQAKHGFNVIILSTTAVGFGVNIQAANHVIHFTRPWNPAKEDQATDRAYRIGQTRSVHVYCPTVVAQGYESFDQRVDSLLRDKRALSRDMLAGVQELTVNDFNTL